MLYGWVARAVVHRVRARRGSLLIVPTAVAGAAFLVVAYTVLVPWYALRILALILLAAGGDPVTFGRREARRLYTDDELRQRRSVTHSFH